MNIPNIVSCEEALASGLSPWNVLSIAKFHRKVIYNDKKSGREPSEYNILAIPLIQNLANEMFQELKKLGNKFHFPKKKNKNNRNTKNKVKGGNHVKTTNHKSFKDNSKTHRKS